MSAVVWTFSGLHHFGVPSYMVSTFGATTGWFNLCLKLVVKESKTDKIQLFSLPITGLSMVLEFAISKVNLGNYFQSDLGTF